MQVYVLPVYLQYYLFCSDFQWLKKDAVLKILLSELFSQLHEGRGVKNVNNNNTCADTKKDFKLGKNVHL